MAVVVGAGVAAGGGGDVPTNTASGEARRCDLGAV